MTGVFFMVCVPTCEQEAKIRQQYRIDRLKTHSSTTINYSSEDNRPDVKRCRSTDDVISVASHGADVVRGGSGKSDLRPLEMSRCEVKQTMTAKKDPFKADDENREKLELPGTATEEVPLEKVLSAVLEHAKVKDAAWCNGKDNDYYQVFFSLEGGAACEEVLHLFGLWGVGKEWNSVVSVIPCALYYHGSEYRDTRDGPNYSLNQNDVSQNAGFCRTEHLKGLECLDKRTAWSKFVSSVRTRLTVAQVVQLIRTDAALTFDWLFLLIVSAFVAAIGLIENSTVFLVASMLISPLMGPIMAGTFGTAIKDRDLQKIGVLHELFGLFLALVIGFLFGLILCGIDEKYGDGEWPTFEMMSRCELRSLWVGALIAVPSGAAVAIAVLGDNTASLVGVAISASLLPPAVNAGLLWAMALIHLVFLDDETRFTTIVKTTVYSFNPATELAVNGTISLCLTLVNIICIYFAGILVYKIKEVRPINKKIISFWNKNYTATQQNHDGNGSHIEENGSTDENDNPADLSNLRCTSHLRTPDHCNGCKQRATPHCRAACNRYHLTWSPASLDNIMARPHVRDLAGYYHDNPTVKPQLSQTDDALFLRRTHERSQPSRHRLSTGLTAEGFKQLLGSKRYKHMREDFSPARAASHAEPRSSASGTPQVVADFPGAKFVVTRVPAADGNNMSEQRISLDDQKSNRFIEHQKL